MSERPSPSPRTRRGRILLGGGCAAVLIALLLFFTLAPDREPPPQEVTYSALLAALEEGRVLHVTVVDGRKVEGLLKNGSAVNASETGEPPLRFQSLLPFPSSDHLVKQLHAAGVPIDARDSEDALWSSLLPVLAWAFVIGLLGLFFLKGPGSQVLQHTRSRSNLVQRSGNEVSFANVAGADEAKADLEEIVAFLRAPRRFTRLGGRMPRGALLTGDPGNGKTLLARAVSGEAGCSYFTASGSDFVEMYVGTGAARIRDLFKQARAQAPAIVFIDEIDAIGRRRGDGGNTGGQDEREQALNQLLVELDGFEASESVVVIAATNRPDVLDPALLRPGRFDRRISVDYPDLKGREGILRVHATALPLGPDISLEALARGTAGMSGADLANIVNEAALGAARRGSTSVDMRDLEDARDRVLLGSERRSMVLTPAEKRLTAYHEAGHAIVGLILPELDPVHKVTIVPRGRALGVTASLPVRDRHTHSRAQLGARLVMLMAGRAAEEGVLGEEEVTTGAGSDIERATQIARQMVVRFGMSPRVGMVDVSGEKEAVAEHTSRIVDEEIRRIVEEAYMSACRILSEHRDLMDRMAEALLERETLGGEELELLVRGDRLPDRPGDRMGSSEPEGRTAA